MQAEDAPIVSGVGDQEHDSLDAQVARLRRNPPFQRLDVMQVGLGFDQDGAYLVADHGIRAPPVAGNRHGNLDLPAQRVRNPSPQALKDGKLSTIPNGVAVGMERRRELKPEHRRDLGDLVDPHRLVAAQHPNDRVPAHRGHSRQLAEAEARAHLGLQKLVGESLPQHAAPTHASIRRRVADWHPVIMTRSALLPVTRLPSPVEISAIRRLERVPGCVPASIDA